MSPSRPHVAYSGADGGRRISVGDDVDGEVKFVSELRHGGRHPMGEIDAPGTDTVRDAAARQADEAEVEEVSTEIVLSPGEVGEERGEEAEAGVVRSGEQLVGQGVAPLAEILREGSREMREHPCGIVGLLRIGGRHGDTEHVIEDCLAARGAYSGDDASYVVSVQAN